ncbi:unnamed protein product [Pseudo-nitzschia multistriata]|uniref:NIF system FeS cluster assembly NifU C-terminal domain-containing protein n=1 Tax=Pseudo-nitzschia multistriata TaxID=183589 RepID=A0A448ZLJ6_9STRA|nr:unnamed protein product [Pseudo-nitzschia multistriata]
MASVLSYHIIVLVIAVTFSMQDSAAFVSPGSKTIIKNNPLVVVHASDWSDFGVLDDDDDDILVDRREYAKEEDDQEVKAQVGASLDPPSIDDESALYDPLFVPAGSQLELDEETVLRLMQACRQEIGTLFGYTAENRGVGITGGVDYVELDGPVVVLRLKGRFWHERTTVLSRVANYLQQRIPEIIDVTVEDEWQLSQEANEAF